MARVTAPVMHEKKAEKITNSSDYESSSTKADAGPSFTASSRQNKACNASQNHESVDAPLPAIGKNSLRSCSILKTIEKDGEVIVCIFILQNPGQKRAGALPTPQSQPKKKGPEGSDSTGKKSSGKAQPQISDPAPRPPPALGTSRKHQQQYSSMLLDQTKTAGNAKAPRGWLASIPKQYRIETLPSSHPEPQPTSPGPSPPPQDRIEKEPALGRVLKRKADDMGHPVGATEQPDPKDIERLWKFDRELRWSLFLTMTNEGVASCIRTVYGEYIEPETHSWARLHTRGLNSIKTWKNGIQNKIMLHTRDIIAETPDFECFDIDEQQLTFENTFNGANFIFVISFMDKYLDVGNSSALSSYHMKAMYVNLAMAAVETIKLLKTQNPLGAREGLQTVLKALGETDEAKRLKRTDFAELRERVMSQRRTAAPTTIPKPVLFRINYRIPEDEESAEEQETARESRERDLGR